MTSGRCLVSSDRRPPEPVTPDEWEAIVEKYALKAPPSILDFVGYNSLVYADMVLPGGAQLRLPALNSTIAARQAGFHIGPRPSQTLAKAGPRAWL